MKLPSFAYGLLIGLSASVFYELNQAAIAPHERGDIEASQLDHYIKRIQTCKSIADAEYFLAENPFLKTSTKWGDVLPPIVDENSITLRIRKRACGNTYFILEGTATF